MEKQIILEGLECATCSSKIEDQTNKLEEVKDATISIVDQKMRLSMIDGADFSVVLNKIKQIVEKLEPDVVVKYSEPGSTVDKIAEIEAMEKEIKKERNESLLKIIIGAVLFGITFFIDDSSTLRYAIFTMAYVFVGSEVVMRSFRNILQGNVFDENFLMTIATVGAMVIGEYPEAIAVMLFYQVGEFFQDLAVNRSRSSIKALLDVKPEVANIKIGDEIVEVAPEEVNIGDIMVVRPGEKIPLDGVVIKGETRVNTAALTGESVPRKVDTGETVLSGFVNETGLIEVEVQKSYGESAISKVLDLVQNASSKKAPTEKFITKFARYYTPAVVVGALVLGLVVPLVLGEEIAKWGYRALVFLVISCPCALVVSVPLGYFGGIGAASKKGILIKGGNFLEALNQVEKIAFDKTGTLTKGVFNVQKIDVAEGFTEQEVLEYAAIAEVHSNHPIGRSIMDKYGEEIDEKRIEEYKEISGHGLEVVIDGRKVLVGNKRHLNANDIEVEDKTELENTVVYIGIDGKYAGKIEIADELKEDAIESIKAIKARGIKETIMLSGDQKAVADKISAKLGLDKYYAELLPEQKVEKIEELEENTAGKIAYVGDGINDAPVLARADVGISMGGLGSDLAIEASDIVIMTDEISKIATVFDISKKTQKIVIQNIVFSLGVKAIMLALGAAGIAGMWEAVFADVGVSVIAILNSMRALRV